MMVMSVKQSEFINSLMAQREIPQSISERRFASLVDSVRGGDKIDVRNASDLIGWLLSLPKVEQAAATLANGSNPATDEGVYMLGDEVVKMKRSKAGRLYAMRLVEIGGSRLTEMGEVVNFEWQYSPDLTRQVSKEHKMTLDQAKALGIRYGRCMRCGRRLKDAASVDRAMGPVCVASFE